MHSTNSALGGNRCRTGRELRYGIAIVVPTRSSHSEYYNNTRIPS